MIPVNHESARQYMMQKAEEMGTKTVWNRGIVADEK